MPALQRANQRAGARGRQNGSAVMELALFMSVAAPLLMGLTFVGIRLGRGIQATQLTRDVGHMYVLGADFTVAGTQAIAQSLAGGFNLASNGTAVLILSRVAKVQQVDCTAAGLANCPNLGQPVFTQRVVFGNSSLRASNHGTPPAGYVGSKGVIQSSDYCQQTSLIATGFEAVMTLQPGQATWMVEGYFAMADLNTLNGGNENDHGGFYVRLLF